MNRERVFGLVLACFLLLSLLVWGYMIGVGAVACARWFF